MTHLTVSIMVLDLDAALDAARRAKAVGADLVEYRIDRFTDDRDAVVELLRRSPLPCILTCRPTWEGGDYDGDDADRISLLEYAGTSAHPPAYLDIELAAYQRSANLRQKVGLVVDHPGQVRPIDTGLILSSHDFSGRPADLLRRAADMADAPACRVIKLAWAARSLRDNIEAFEIIRQQVKPTIALCMGEHGLPSRVLAKKFGALLTFAALETGAETAPGQPSIKQLKTLYRWDRLDADTRVYGVIGHPVGHSLSPPIHNAGFDAVGYNGVYLPMSIPPEYEHFKATVAEWLACAPLHFHGASVTIPHKQNLLRFVEEQGGEIEPLASTIGAANTLAVRDDGSLYASNTDYAAALDAVCEGLNIAREELAGKRVAVIGAGGAARAIVAGFAHYGATVVIYNRTRDKADELVAAFNGKTGKVVAASPDKLCGACCGVFINCTPLGMHPHVGATPMPDPPDWGPGTVVFDTIYNPLETRLLREAKAAGCHTISGAEMFVRQAATQFESWTQQAAPLDVFRGVIRQHLSQ